MAIYFNRIRERKGTNFEALQKTLEKSGGGGYKKDERVWAPTKKDGKSSNIIRFLPIPAVDFQLVEDGKFKEEDLSPIARIMSHAFQAPNGWFIENGLGTFGEPCPIREYDQPNWTALKKLDEKLESSKIQKEILKKRLPATTIYANILVIKDGEKPENNGKVFLYKIPATIDKMIKAADKPEFETSPRFDPFDPMTGADLVLNIIYTPKKIGTKEVDVPDFKNAVWSMPKSMCEGDEKQIEEIWRKEYSLLEFYDRKNFKSYDEIKAKFCKAMGMDLNFNPLKPGSTMGASAADFVAGEKPKAADAPQQPSQSAPSTAHVAEERTAEPQSPNVDAAASDVDDDLADFEKMLNG